MTAALSRHQRGAKLEEAYAAAAMVARLPLTELRAEIEHEQTFGPKLDATLCIQNIGKLFKDSRVVDILREAQRQLAALEPSDASPVSTTSGAPAGSAPTSSMQSAIDRAAPMLERQRWNTARRPYSVERADADALSNTDPSRTVAGQGVL